MSSPLPNMADRMLANDIKSQMLRVERNRVSDSQLRVTKAYEKASSSSKCNCNCHSTSQLTPQQIAEDREWERKKLEQHIKFIEQVKKDSACIIL